MKRHEHNWQLINSPLRRYRCTDTTCNVVGYRPAARSVIIPYVCQLEQGDRSAGNRKHCGKPATHVAHSRTAHRCAEHAPAQEQAA